MVARQFLEAELVGARRYDKFAQVGRLRFPAEAADLAVLPVIDAAPDLGKTGELLSLGGQQNAIRQRIDQAPHRRGAEGSVAKASLFLVARLPRMVVIIEKAIGSTSSWTCLISVSTDSARCSRRPPFPRSLSCHALYVGSTPKRWSSTLPRGLEGLVELEPRSRLLVRASALQISTFVLVGPAPPGPP